MRVRKDFTRLEGDKSARLVVIAAEGFETENIYFEAMKTSLRAANVHVEVLRRDRWTNKMLSSVARYCAQNKNLRFCVSNPCFELWLLLHLEDVAAYATEEKNALTANRKSTRHKTWLKHKLSELLDGYNEANYDAAKLLPQIDVAIERAVRLDSKPEDRWPQSVGSRVYLLARSIMGKTTE